PSMWSVPAGGGTPRPLLGLGGEKVSRARWVQHLDPSRVLFLRLHGSYSSPQGGTNRGPHLLLGDLAHDRAIALFPFAARAVFDAPTGHLIFAREGTLRAQPL